MDGEASDAVDFREARLVRNFWYSFPLVTLLAPKLLVAFALTEEDFESSVDEAATLVR